MASEFSFLRYRPFRAQIPLYAAIFFSFTAVGILVEMWASDAVRPWYALPVWAVFSGIVGTGWALAFMRSRRFLWAILPFHVLVPAILSWRIPAIGLNPALTLEKLGPLAIRQSVEALACLLMIVAGYVFFVRFIEGEGTRSMRLQTEMRLAEQIHHSLVPPLTLHTQRLELYGRSVSSTEVGGDLLDYVQHDGRVGLYVADVSGHGVRAGVMMAMVKSAIRMKLITSDELQDVFGDLNQIILQVKEPDVFVTMASLQIDGAGLARYSLAGHPPILWWRHGVRQGEWLDSPHPPLGILTKQSYTASAVSASPGDIFVLLTDGVTEVFDSKENQFGHEPVLKTVADRASEPLSEIYNAIIAAIRRHGSQDDDQTLLLARVM